VSIVRASADSPMIIASRARLSLAVGAFGVALLFASATQPWFGVPDAAPNQLANSLAIVAREAPVTPAFKVLCLLALGAAAWAAMRLDRPRLATARIFSALLGALLLYPHTVMVWCPATAARAAWLEQQHASLTWGGGDVWTSAEYKKLDGHKDRVYVAEMLDESGVMHTPALSPEAIPFESAHDLLVWFGYSNTFCLFVCGGWGVALAGSILLIVAACRSRHGADRQALWAASRTALLFLSGAFVFCLLPAAVCGAQIERSRQAAERGQIGLSLERLELAAQLLPVIRQNSDFVDEIGLLDARLARQTREATLHRAKMMQRQGRLEQADVLFVSIIGANPNEGDMVRREAVRGLLRRGIEKLNSGEPKAALETLETVARADPCNLKANYALQLASLRAMRLESVDALAARMRTVYRYFHTLTKLPVLGAAQENVALAAYLQGDALAAHLAWKKLADPKLLRTER
jgi:hypothetical protein